VKKGTAVCVRARDEFCNSSWSEWSLHKYVYFIFILFFSRRLICVMPKIISLMLY